MTYTKTQKSAVTSRGAVCQFRSMQHHLTMHAQHIRMHHVCMWLLGPHPLGIWRCIDFSQCLGSSFKGFRIEVGSCLTVSGCSSACSSGCCGCTHPPVLAQSSHGHRCNSHCQILEHDRQQSLRLGLPQQAQAPQGTPSNASELTQPAQRSIFEATSCPLTVPKRADRPDRASMLGPICNVMHHIPYTILGVNSYCRGSFGCPDWLSRVPAAGRLARPLIE